MSENRTLLEHYVSLTHNTDCSKFDCFLGAIYLRMKRPVREIEEEQLEEVKKSRKNIPQGYIND